MMSVFDNPHLDNGNRRTMFRFTFLSASSFLLPACALDKLQPIMANGSSLMCDWARPSSGRVDRVL